MPNLTVLDLNVYTKKNLEIKLPANSNKVFKSDGDIIYIVKPSQRMVIEVLKYQQALAAKDANLILDTALNLTIEIFKTARDGYKSERRIKEFVNELPYAALTAIIGEYIAFMNEVKSDPNL